MKTQSLEEQSTKDFFRKNSVYNHTYKNTDWGGYECYSHPLNLFKYQ